MSVKNINETESKPIREPKQKRSIEKKEKILAAGKKLFMEKGYYNTNTAEIAKEAGVSTGIVYNYFKNKDDILAIILEDITNSFFVRMQSTILDHIPQSLIDHDYNNPEVYKYIDGIIEVCIQMHKETKFFHHEMEALASDPNLSCLIYASELDLSDVVKNGLTSKGFNIKNANEKVHLIFHIVEDLCHELVYHKHDEIDYDVYRDIAVRSICNILR